MERKLRERKGETKQREFKDGEMEKTELASLLESSLYSIISYLLKYGKSSNLGFSIFPTTSHRRIIKESFVFKHSMM